MRAHNRLSAIQITNLKPGVRISDGAGLYVTSKPNGRKYFQFRDGSSGSKVRWKSLGPTTKLSLQVARQLTRQLNDRIALGEDIWVEKARVPTFSEIANEYIDQILMVTNPRSREHWHRSIELYAGSLAGKPVNEIDVKAILAVLKPIWTSKNETASRLRGRLARILGYAKAKGYRDGPNPGAWAENLEVLLPAQKNEVAHFKALAYEQLPSFVRDLRKRQGIAARCLELIILCATRSGEATNAEWTEIDWKAETWTIPARRAKTRKDDIVPLSKPALALLKELAETKVSRYIFPGLRADRPITGMAVYKFVKPHGITIHGMRSVFRDWCANETEFPRDLAEEALSHSLGAVEKAYRRGQAVERRRVLMQAFANFVDGKTNRPAMVLVA